MDSMIKILIKIPDARLIDKINLNKFDFKKVSLETQVFWVEGE